MVVSEINRVQMGILQIFSQEDLGLVNLLLCDDDDGDDDDDDDDDDDGDR